MCVTGCHTPCVCVSQNATLVCVTQCVCHTHCVTHCVTQCMCHTMTYSVESHIVRHTLSPLRHALMERLSYWRLPQFHGSTRSLETMSFQLFHASSKRKVLGQYREWTGGRLMTYLWSPWKLLEIDGRIDGGGGGRLGHCGRLKYSVRKISACLRLPVIFLRQRDVISAMPARLSV